MGIYLLLFVGCIYCGQPFSWPSIQLLWGCPLTYVMEAYGWISYQRKSTFFLNTGGKKNILLLHLWIRKRRIRPRVLLLTLVATGFVQKWSHRHFSFWALKITFLSFHSPNADLEKESTPLGWAQEFIHFSLSPKWQNATGSTSTF